jgi:hypothetical protein
MGSQAYTLSPLSLLRRIIVTITSTITLQADEGRAYLALERRYLMSES